MTYALLTAGGLFVFGMVWFAFCLAIVSKRSDEAMRRITEVSTLGR